MNQTSLKLWRKRIADQRASSLKRIESVEGGGLETTKMPVFAELKPTFGPLNETEDQLQISWKDFQISISTAGSARLAAEFIRQLQELC